VSRLITAIAALTGALLLSTAPVAAQDWPTRPVRIVNTFAPGGAADVLARIAADQLSSAFRQQFFVETRAGAAGAIGVQSVAHADPDGYNFVITTLSLLVIGPIINPKLGYDPFRDLTHIAYLAGSPVVFTVNRASGVRTLQDFIAHAKKSDKPLTYSSSGIGSNGQLIAESFARKAGIKVEHVPYKGAAQGLMDLVGGHIAFAAQTLSSSSGQIRGGTLVPLAHTGSERFPDYPDVPTFKELGYDLVSTNWFALAGPAGLAGDIVHKVNREIARAMSKPEVRERLRQDGMASEDLEPQALVNFIEGEVVRWKPVIKQVGLAAE
jgi:tripartite-type tricarboxylate transporter receptor subunit TctC